MPSVKAEEGAELMAVLLVMFVFPNAMFVVIIVKFFPATCSRFVLSSVAACCKNSSAELSVS